MIEFNAVEPRFDLDDPSIVIHVDYDYITAGQLATLIRAIDDLYGSVARLLVYDAFEYVRAPNIVIHAVPLIVTRVETSHSIELEFKLTSKTLPSIYSHDGKLGVAIPQWVAVIAVTGSLLIGGISDYGKVLDVLIKHKELEIKTLELLEKSRKAATHDSAVSAAIQAHIQEIRTVFLSKNIGEVTINGTIINCLPKTTGSGNAQP